MTKQFDEQLALARNAARHRADRAVTLPESIALYRVIERVRPEFGAWEDGALSREASLRFAEWRRNNGLGTLPAQYLSAISKIVQQGWFDAIEAADFYGVQSPPRWVAKHEEALAATTDCQPQEQPVPGDALELLRIALKAQAEATKAFGLALAAGGDDLPALIKELDIEKGQLKLNKQGQLVVSSEYNNAVARTYVRLISP